jgi:uncharacterized protein YecE (DUF72 family)
MLRIGSAGWDYKDWVNVAYPPSLTGTDRLSYLTTLFEVVEINVTFYRPIDAPLAQRWLDAVKGASNFRFTAKLLNIFTHERRLPQEELTRFQAGLRPLLEAGRLGVLLAQFPYSFHNTEENRAYLVKVKREFGDFPVAVEVRHRSWQRREIREFLQEVGLDFVNIDQPLVSYPMGHTAWVTGKLGYLRAHGRRKESWFEFGQDRQARYDYLYAPEELEDLAARAEELMEKAREVYVIFNNHPTGQAVVNALEMAHRLAGRTFALPSCLVNAFPRLAELSR